MFVYVGGDSDEWVDGVLDSMDTTHVTMFKLMDKVQTVEEETVEGMEPDDDDDEDEGPEMDEHVWTSPKNAMTTVEKMANEIAKLDSPNKDTYKKNAEKYISEIQKLDDEFRKSLKTAREKK